MNDYLPVALITGAAHGLGREVARQLAATGRRVLITARDADAAGHAAAELAGTPILVNAVCPGLTATFPDAEAMGARAVTDSATGIVWATTLPDDGPRGGFFRDTKFLPW